MQLDWILGSCWSLAEEQYMLYWVPVRTEQSYHVYHCGDLWSKGGFKQTAFSLMNYWITDRFYCCRHALCDCSRLSLSSLLPWVVVQDSWGFRSWLGGSSTSCSHSDSRLKSSTLIESKQQSKLSLSSSSSSCFSCFTVICSAGDIASLLESGATWWAVVSWQGCLTLSAFTTLT